MPDATSSLSMLFVFRQRKNSIHNICGKPLSWTWVETTNMSATKLLIDLMYARFIYCPITCFVKVESFTVN